MTPPLKRGGAPLKRAGRRIHRGTAAPVSLTIATRLLGTMQATVPIASPGFDIVAINGGSQVHTWSILSGPSWLSISGSDAHGRILGTPPAGSEGDITVVVKVTTPDGQQDTETLVGTVDPAVADLTISTTALGTMRNGTAIAAPGFAVQAVNGSGPFAWAKVSGPSWATVDTTITGRTGRVLGTPNATGPVTVRVRVTDSLGASFEQDLTGTVLAATAALDITTTTFGDMLEGTAIAAPGFAIVAANGTGPFTWSKVSGPSWLTLDGSTSRTLRITGTPPVGSAGTISANFKIVDSLGAQATQVVTGAVTIEDTSGFDGYFDGRIGFTKNNATQAKVLGLIDLIQGGAGNKRITGGLVRWDMGGTPNGGTDSADDSLLTAINAKGVYAAPILGYTDKSNQRRLHFDGEINASKNVMWKDGLGGYHVGTGIQQQMGSVAKTINGNSHPAKVPSSSNAYYKGPSGGGFYGNGLSIHGPGIPCLLNYPCSITSGSNILTIALPTGDNPGANCGTNWVGQEISVSGVAGGATITAVVAGGLRMSANASATGSRNCTIMLPGMIPFECDSQVSGSTGLVMVQGHKNAQGAYIDTAYIDKLTNGASGTYWVGGTNASLDMKIWYDDPEDYQRVVYNTVHDCNVPVKRAKRFELWNEMPWGMGCRPLVSIPRAAQLLCHGYVAVKLADPSAIVSLPGPGHVSASTNNWLSAPDWADALLNYWYNVDPTYFSDLLAANGLTKARAPKIPGDEWGCHPYDQNPSVGSAMGMAQLATVYNMIGAATSGIYLPMAPTEQGVNWTRAGGGGLPNAATAGLYMNNYLRQFLGIIPWGNNVRLNGPGTNTHLPNGDGSAGTITVANRMAKMRKVISCATMFASQPPADSPNRGIAYNFDGSQKYVIGSGDPVDMMIAI